MKTILNIVKERLRTSQYLHIVSGDGRFDFSATKAMKEWRINGFRVLRTDGNKVSSRIILTRMSLEEDYYSEVIGSIDSYRSL